MSTGQGLSYLAGGGMKKEATFGEGPSVDVYGQILSETFSSDNGLKEDESIVGDSELKGLVEGLETAGGALNLYPFGGQMFGDLLACTTRNVASAALPYSVTGAPTVTATTGGSVAAGVYRGVVQAIMSETKTGWLFGTNVSPSSSTATTSSGTQTLSYSWSAPSGADLLNFPGFTHWGYAIGRTAPAGSSGTEKYLALQTGSGTTFDDDGTNTLSAVAFGATVYWHKFKGAAAQPPSFTLEVLKNIGISEKYDGCMVNSLQANWKPGEIPTAPFECFARHMTPITSSSPTYPATLQPMVGHTLISYIQVAGASVTQNAYLESIQWQLNNNLERVYRCNGSQQVDEITAGPRRITGSANFSFKSDTELNNFVNGSTMEIFAGIKAPVISGGTTSPASVFTFSITGTSYTVRSFPYFWGVHMPNVRYKTHKANINTKNRIVQDVAFMTAKDATAGYAHRMVLADLCSSH